MTYFEVPTRVREQFVNITKQVQQAVEKLGIFDGTVTVFVPHATCGITVNENADPNVLNDMLQQLDCMVPLRQPFYKHAEGNSAAHLKASLMGCSLHLIVTCGHLNLGVWQSVYLCACAVFTSREPTPTVSCRPRTFQRLFALRRCAIFNTRRMCENL